MTARGATIVAFMYTVGAGVLLFGLYTYATSPGGHDPTHGSVRVAVVSILLGALLLALPAVIRRWTSLRGPSPTPPRTGPPPL